MRRPHIALHRKADRYGRLWRIYLPDQDSFGALHLGRYRIDFGLAS